MLTVETDTNQVHITNSVVGNGDLLRSGEYWALNGVKILFPN